MGRGAGAIGELDALRDALERDPRGVVRDAGHLVARYRTADDHAGLSRTLAVLGRAHRGLGEIDLAASVLAEAVAAGESSGDDEITADAHLGLAGVLSFSGGSEAAFEHLDVVDRRGTERQRAYAMLQRAAVAQRLGDVGLALTSYEAALPVLRAGGSPVDVAKVLANRGAMRVRAGQVAAALADLAEAAELFESAGQDFAAAQVVHNLGWAAARLGDLPGALAALDRAEAAFARLDVAADAARVDRAEILLAAGLAAEARATAAEAADRLALVGNLSVAAQAWLLCAQACRVDGDPDAALAHAERARLAFADQGAAVAGRAAELESFQAREAGPGLGPADVPTLVRLAHELDRRGNALGEVTALALATLASARGGRRMATRPAELAERCITRAGSLGGAEARLLAARAAASAAEARGDRRGARRVARAALAELERGRVALAATAARAQVAAHGRSLAAVGLRLAVDDGSAEVALEWMERSRAAALRHPAAHPPDDERLTAALAELRVVSADRRLAELDGTSSAELTRRQAVLEDAIRRRQPARPPVRTGQLRAALDGRAMAVMAHVGDGLHAVVVGRRRSRLVDLGPTEPITNAADAATKALRGLAVPGGPAAARAARERLLADASATLDRLVVGPLRLGDGGVVLVVPGRLHSAPWRAVPSLAGRAVSIAPSATWWLATAASEGRRSGRALVVAGPRLAEAEREAVAVAACHVQPLLLTGARSTTAAVASALATAPLAHLVAHGRFRHDNPLWSAIELVDGSLAVYDLQRLACTPPEVVLSACESGLSGGRAGDELLGLAGALLGAGTRSLVASIGPLPDSPETGEAMVTLHRRLAGGMAPSEALAAIGGEHEGRAGQAIGACLACFGL